MRSSLFHACLILFIATCSHADTASEFSGKVLPVLEAHCIACHGENDPSGEGIELAKALAVAQGGDKAGILESSFVAEVKSDLMGEQTILCGLLQAGSILCFEKMKADGIDTKWAVKFIQNGWEVITEALKHGGITNMMDRLSNPAKIEAFVLSEELKDIMRDLFYKHMDDIISGEFSSTMMADWANDDLNLLGWRKATGETEFEKTEGEGEITEQEYFDKGILMIAMVPGSYTHPTLPTT